MKKHGTAEEITGLTVNCYGSNNICLSCRYELEERDGAVLFSCCFYDVDEGVSAKKIELKRVSVDPVYMRRLREFVEEYDYLNQKDDDPGKRKFLVRDALECSVTYNWADYDDLTIHSMLRLPPGGDELKKIFRDLAEKYAEG